MENIALAAALVISNIAWMLAFRFHDKTNLEVSKLIASRTLSEYAWLAKAESGEAPKPREAGYDNVFEEEENDQVR